MKKIKFVAKKNTSVKKLLEDNYISKRAINKIIKSGIDINGIIINKNMDLSVGDYALINIEDEELDYEPIYSKLNILYEDDHIIVIDKKGGITMNSKNHENLSNHIAYYFKDNNIKSKVRLINRLDMNTSGIMLVAKNKYAQSYYQKQIEDNKLIKKYIAYVEGKFDINEKFVIKLAYDKDNKNYIKSSDGKEAITIFKTLESNDKFSIIEARILTGKTHQIRASLSYLKHPIIGDYLYGSKYEFERFLLHSYFIEFKEFISGQVKTITSNYNFNTYIDII